jgi:tetratricopeptide (TPR) repeat protein
MHPVVEHKAQLADLPEVAALKRRRRRLALALLVFALLGVMVAKPCYTTFRSWRARALAADAAKLILDGQLDAALAKARSAHQLVPTEPSALRAIGDVLAARRDFLNAVVFYEEVVKQTGSVEDRIRHGECALRAGALQRAEEELVFVLREHADFAATHLFAARCYIARRDLVSAAAAARHALELSESDEVRLLLGRLLIQEVSTREEGKRVLQELSKLETVSGLAALLQLSGNPGAGPEELLTLAASIRSHPRVRTGDRLHALDLEIRALPEEATAKISVEEAKFVNTSPEELRTFCMWLAGRRDHERVLRLLPVDQASTRKDLFVLRLDAMAALGQWKEVVECLERNAPLEAALIHLYRARCWRELSETAKSEAAWRLAISSATSDRNLLRYVASYAEKSAEREHAMRAYRVLANHAQTARAGFDGLLRLTPRNDSVALRELLSSMAKQWPEDSAIVNDLAYLDVLLGDRIAENGARAEALVATAPESLPHRTVLALAKLKEGDPQAALKVYDGLRIDWRVAAPGAAAVYASVLGQAGHRTAAESVASEVKIEHLRPEERELLSGIVAK